MAQVVVCLSSKCEFLGSILSIAKNRKKKGENKQTKKHYHWF